MKSENVSKQSLVSKVSKKVKVADLPKGKKKTKDKPATGFTRGMGLFFICIVGILAGLLSFTMIVQFGASDALEESILAQTSGATGKTLKTETFTPAEETSFHFSFDHATTSTVTYFNKGGDSSGMYVMNTTPQFSPEGVSVVPVAGFEFSRESIDDTVTSLLKKGGTTKKVTVDGTDGVEVTNPKDAFTLLVFKAKNIVYVGKFSTEKDKLAEAAIVKGSIKLAK